MLIDGLLIARISSSSSLFGRAYCVRFRPQAIQWTCDECDQNSWPYQCNEFKLIINYHLLCIFGWSAVHLGCVVCCVWVYLYAIGFVHLRLHAPHSRLELVKEQQQCAPEANGETEREREKMQKEKSAHQDHHRWSLIFFFFLLSTFRLSTMRKRSMFYSTRL